MNLFAKIKEIKAKRQEKLEERQINTFTNAQSRIEQLEKRKAQLKERESVFKAKQKLEEEIKEKEIRVNQLQRKERNPMFASLQSNIRAKINESQKKSKPSLSSGFNNPFSNPGKSNPNYYTSGKSNPNFYTSKGTNPFMSSPVVRAKKKKNKTIVIKI